jgi:hypothetical protein
MKLPKLIHVTCKDKHDITNPVWRDCLQKYYEMYSPEYEIRVHDNLDIYSTIESHFPQYLEKIKKITVGAVLADVFRYLILYLEGGIYSDLDCEPLKHVGALLDSNYQYFHGDENRDNAFFVYADPSKIVNKQWDFCSNPCDNSAFVRDSAANRNPRSPLIHCSSVSGHLKAFAEPTAMKCLGHGLGADVVRASTILCYEFHEDWINNAYFFNDDRCCYKKVGICQWFMMTEPKQDVFLKMFMHCMKNIDRLVELNPAAANANANANQDNYHTSILSTCGPLAFTRTVVDDMLIGSNKILILPSDFFCCGSFNDSVPLTKNSFVKHHFTSSWR